MTQQVVYTKVKLTDKDTLKQSVSFGITFEALGPGTSVSFSAIATKVNTFLNVESTGQTNQLNVYLGESIAHGTGTVTLESYDVTAHLDGSPAGAPVDVRTINLSGSGPGSPVPTPEGCCALLRFNGPYGSDTEFGPGDRPRQRDRGRIYFGPLDGNAFVFNTTVNEVLLSNPAINDFYSALYALYQLGTDTDQTTPVQWSRANAAVKQTIAWAVDSRPKYQRRRAKA